MICHAQMGSSMKPTIFNERVAKALRNWHHTAKKHVKKNKGSASVTPMSSRPGTPSHHAMSPVHLLRYYRNEVDSLQNSPRRSVEYYDTDSPSPSHHHNYGEGSSSSHQPNTQVELSIVEYDGKDGPSLSQVAPIPQESSATQYETDRPVPKDFSFDRRTDI